MSAMTGSRSPTSPWPSECQNLQLDQTSNSTPFFTFCDAHPGSHGPAGLGSSNTVLERPSPNHFSISVDSPGSFANNREPVPHAQPAISYPKVQPSNNRTLDNNPTTSKSGIAFNNHLKTSAGLGFPRNRDLVFPGVGAPSGQLTFMDGCPISIDDCAGLLESSDRDVMLLDVRPYAHFARGTIDGSLNLCIPTTLLKRPSFDTQKLANTFTADSDKMKFARWRQFHYIVVFDAATSDMKDAGPLANVLKKFTSEGWDGEARILLGGFKTFASRFPHLVRQQQLPASGAPTKKTPRMHIDLPSAAPVAGGCALPESSHAAIPFFANIRQHTDLVDGVGQIPLQLPSTLTEPKRQRLPSWLRDVSETSDRGRKVSERFLALEKREFERMKRALSYDKSANSAAIDTSSEKYRVAGIEKGTKNRYNDIYPFEHSRVRLQNVSPGGCDYVNGNHLKAEKGGKCYIATQAPVPDTFDDFWRVIWEQDVRLVVSLTAEVERGQVKCHPYWKSGEYGQCQVNNFSQKLIYLNSRDSPQVDLEGNQLPPDVKDDPGNPYIVVRHFGLSHSAFPFQPLREVTQLQYPHWPDFGTTSQPTHLLRLIEYCDRVLNATNSPIPGSSQRQAADQRPVLVHCSAGCGRTGAFCTVDTVLDIMKRQRGQGAVDDMSSRPTEGQWEFDEGLDLIEKTVDDFRRQRPSMVQNLSQFVLCYESVLEWVVSHMGE
ncbi:putative protein tyrosine phosphatase (Pyp1) [Aspergillus homomorphus CBS 101889]|uniref:protein-tyrosine-phosphatase n=1 Tax=Aspergillus homomorphus (strain CBS 101889) TaxID=1450537 RepID=A0A395I099_ASPHC|nr:hypothetical protein BO97DRAFT_342369 [Aspergillus homomorphus CBS 101889]RAL13621.1 hypothetical protein BO97DRAFT_342369 [Aspergillus homomorphus CBS 101889]